MSLAGSGESVNLPIGVVRILRWHTIKIWFNQPFMLNWVSSSCMEPRWDSLVRYSDNILILHARIRKANRRDALEFQRGFDTQTTSCQIPSPLSMVRPALDSYPRQLCACLWQMFLSFLCSSSRTVLLHLLHRLAFLSHHQMLNIFLFVWDLSFNSRPFRFFWVLASRKLLQH